nr:JAB domain-containing protein [Lacticaseibacillus manihotivorans]
MHNHPSGNVTPSQADVLVTRRFVQAGELIGVVVLDHVIIGHMIIIRLQGIIKLNFFSNNPLTRRIWGSMTPVPMEVVL